MGFGADQTDGCGRQRTAMLTWDSWRGRVKVEVLNADDGQPLPGYTFDENIAAMVDSIDEPMRWKEKPDLADLRGRTVRLRFSLLPGRTLCLLAH